MRAQPRARFCGLSAQRQVGYHVRQQGGAETGEQRGEWPLPEARIREMSEEGPQSHDRQQNLTRIKDTEPFELPWRGKADQDGGGRVGV